MKASTKDLGVPALLLLLSVVPMAGAVLRLRSLSEPVSAESARFVGSPAPILLHLVSAAVYCLLGAFQFSASVRRRYPGWHRRAGKLVAACGVVAGATGVWMAASYAIPSALQGSLLLLIRLAVGGGMVAAIAVAVLAILRRDVPRHEAWMLRAYALGQGAGTQVLVLGLPSLFTGEIVGPARDVLMGVAWALNLGVAEWLVRRRAAAPVAAGPRLSAAAPPA